MIPNPYYLYSLWGLLVISFILGAPLQARTEIQWESVPLTTLKQMRKGVSGGEGLQMVMDISYAPSNPMRAYLVSDTAQVWRSDDGGRSWKSKQAGFRSHGGRSLAVHPHNPDVVAVAGFFPHPHNYALKKKKRRQGVYLTTDGGESWTLKLVTDYFRQDSQGRVIVFDPREKDVIWTGSWSEGLMRSSDLGESWDKVGLAGKRIVDIATSPDLDDIYIATESGLYRYDGVEFHLLKMLPDWPRAVAVSNEGSVWTALGPAGVYFSKNEGETFQRKNDGLPMLPNITDIEVSSVSPQRLYCKNSLTRSAGIYYSHDLGGSWNKPINYDATNLNPTNRLFYFPSPMATHPLHKDEALIVSNGKGLVLATDDGGVNLHYSSSGYTGGRLGSISFRNNGDVLFGLYDHGLYMSRDNCRTFQYVDMDFPRAQQSVLACAQREESIVTLSSTHNKPNIVSVSSNGGQSWLHRELSDKKGPPFIHIEKVNEEAIYVMSNVSRDGGYTWRLMRYPCVAARKDNGILLLYGFDSAKDAFRLMKSVDGGRTWSQATPWCNVPGRQIHEVAVDQNGGCYVAAGYLGVLSWLSGDKWSRASETDKTFKGINIKRVIITREGLLFAGSWAPGEGQGEGVFLSIDNGHTFTNITGRLGPFLTVWCLGYSEKDSTLFIGTSRGTYRRVVDSESTAGK